MDRHAHSNGDVYSDDDNDEECTGSWVGRCVMYQIYNDPWWPAQVENPLRTCEDDSI